MKKLITLISILVVIAVAWLLLDNRSQYPKSDEEPAASLATTTAPATVTDTITTSSTNTTMHHTVTIETNKGTIVFETYDNDAPKTVANFISLANKGFYNNLIFHRVIEGFMIQGGDPTGTGTGGPGYKFADELNPNTDSYKAGYDRGVVAMANSGPDTNGSQFFIMHEDNQLEHKYTIFGKVIKGMEVVDAIASVKTNGHPQAGGTDRPLQDVVMKKVTVAEVK